MRYYKIYKYILEIDLCDDSISNENRNDIVDKYYATYKTNKFKIINIENMITNENITKLYEYNIGDIVKKNITYFFNKECAFFYLENEYFEGSYKYIDKLYYVDFFKQHNKIYNGIHKSWYANGILREEFYHIDGKLEGLYKEYNNKGKINILTNFIDDICYD